MSIPLGQKIATPTKYNPDLLYPISRDIGRKNFTSQQVSAIQGIDIWTLWECSWLNNYHMPEQGVVRMIVPANSSHIVESKSLKLYLYSLNNQVFENKEEYLKTLRKDLSPILGMSPKLNFQSYSQLQRQLPKGECAELQITNNKEYQLKFEDRKLFLETQATTNNYYSEVFQSLCPVTGQPDYACVYIQNTTIKMEGLLNYWLSFRRHQGFHEQCVELMYLECNQQIEQPNLVLGGAFLRRGGIDIHPIRHSENTSLDLDFAFYTFRQ